MDRRLVAVSFVVALAAAGCGEEQPAEPLVKTLPVGLGIVAATVAALWSIVHRTLRQLDPRPSAPATPARDPRSLWSNAVLPAAQDHKLIVGRPATAPGRELVVERRPSGGAGPQAGGGERGAGGVLRWPRATAVAAMAPTALAGVALTGMVGLVVAFGYREPQVSIFTWVDTVVIAAVVAGLSIGGTALAGLVSVSLDRPGAARGAALALLGVVVVLGGVALAGLTVVWLPAALLALVTQPAGGRAAAPA